jgi:hypothetical protein
MFNDSVYANDNIVNVNDNDLIYIIDIYIRCCFIYNIDVIFIIDIYYCT